MVFQGATMFTMSMPALGCSISARATLLSSASTAVSIGLWSPVFRMNIAVSSAAARPLAPSPKLRQNAMLSHSPIFC